MPSPEFLVVSACAVLLLLVVALTIVTQFDVDVRWLSDWLAGRGGFTWSSTWRDTAVKRKLKSRSRRRTWKRKRRNDGGSEASRGEEETGRNPPQAVDSSFRQYEEHLRERKERERQVLCVQLHNIKANTLQLPCCGCGVVNAKRNCSYTCCASCCRNNKLSVCKAHGTGYLAASAAVNAAVQHQFLEFDLSYAHVRKCPSNITSIGSQLVSLNLSNNRLACLPEDIGSLCSLQELFLQYNCLTELPNSICDLADLVELDVKNNRLSELPDNIGNLTSLVILSLTNNTVIHLPQSIGSLVQLEELSLHSNHLSELPDDICHLRNLKVMYAGENHLHSLPCGFGRLSLLEELDLSGCELESLPDSLPDCWSLVRLWLSNNRLVSLPLHIGNLRQLKELHVRHNRLKFLPASIDRLQLYTFTAQNNCFIDDHTAKTLCWSPKGSVPPLLELAAQVVLRHNLSWHQERIPTILADMLRHPSQCSACGGPIFRYCSSSITYKTIGVFFRVPLYQRFCLSHLSAHT